MNERRIHSNDRKGTSHHHHHGGGAGRGTGGTGKGLGGGRGAGGRGSSKNAQQPAAAAAASQNNKKQNKKANRQALQLASMQKKADAEDLYFRQCQREAAARNKQQRGGVNNKNEEAAAKKRELELFGGVQHRAQGINFEKYNDIKVEVKRGSSAGTASSSLLQEEEFSDFDQLLTNLHHPTIRRNVQLMHYKAPTPIQRHAIPLALAGDDLMCCAQTGSGKTCSFLLPICASLVNTTGTATASAASNNNSSSIPEGVSPRCIVLAPTRELASQIQVEAEKLCHGIPFLHSVAVYGGASQREQLRNLAYASAAPTSTSSPASQQQQQQPSNMTIVVATPGRLTDFVERSIIKLDKVQYLVLDEADRMLDMGFEPQIRRLVQKSGMTTKQNRQTLLFSATFPDKIQVLATEFLRPSYAWIAVGRVGSTTDSITQVIVQAPRSGDKREKLRLVVQAIQKGPTGRTLVFVQKKRTATWVKRMLNKGGPDDATKGVGASNTDNNKDQLTFTPMAAEDIHGDRSQSQREAALASFRSGKTLILVATEVAARGLDIGGIEHVVNMDLPTAADDFDSYVHRIGRTGRAGHTGLATSLYVPGDTPKLGNAKIAALLIRQLKESKQEVPSWLESDCAGGGGGGGGRSGPSGSGGGRGAIGTDVRSKNGGRNSGRGGGRGGSGGRSGRRGGQDRRSQSKAK